MVDIGKAGMDKEDIMSEVVKLIDEKIKEGFSGSVSELWEVLYTEKKVDTFDDALSFVGSLDYGLDDATYYIKEYGKKHHYKAEELNTRKMDMVEIANAVWYIMIEETIEELVVM